MHRRAFSYVELTMVILLAGIVIAYSVSSEDNDGSDQARAFALQFEADVAYAQSLSISNPDDPAVIRVDGERQRYWLAHLSDTEQPIDHPIRNRPYVVSVGPDGDPAYSKLTLVGTNFGDGHMLTLLPTGDTDLETDAVVQVEAAGAPFEIKRSAASGKTSTEDRFVSATSSVLASRASGGKSNAAAAGAANAANGTNRKS